MPQITWTELVLALTVIGLRRAWRVWREVPTYCSHDELAPLVAPRVTTQDPSAINRA